MVYCVVYRYCGKKSLSNSTAERLSTQTCQEGISKLMVQGLQDFYFFELNLFQKKEI